jgi:hypothetical protein
VVIDAYLGLRPAMGGRFMACHRKLVSSTLLALLAACTAGGESTTSKRTFAKEEFGETPKAKTKPGVSDATAAEQGESFLSLLDENGTPKHGVTNKRTTLSDGDRECSIAAGSLVYLVAEQKADGSVYYIAQLPTPCTLVRMLELGGGDGSDGSDGGSGGGDKDKEKGGDLAEGNIPKGDVDIVEGDPTQGGTDAADGGDPGEPKPETGCTAVEQFRLDSKHVNQQATRPETASGPKGCVYDPTAVAEAKQPGTASSSADVAATLLVAQNRSPCMIPGALIRDPDGAIEGAMALRITAKGKALKFKTTAKPFQSSTVVKGSTTPSPPEMPEKIVDLAAYKTARDDVYEVPFGAFMVKNDWRSREVTIDIAAVDDLGREGTAQCHHGFRMASPLVLDFSGSDVATTVTPADSHAAFDLTASGMRVATGWVRPVDALLALDLNHNGKIDDGAELFGEATRVATDRRARDGYQALAQYDADGDGWVDAKDPVYPHLLAWFDRDGDGTSVASELVALSAAGVTRLGVSAQSVPAELAFQASGDGPGNLVPLRAPFEGPGCRATQGSCWSFDVYFGSLAAGAVASK